MSKYARSTFRRSISHQIFDTCYVSDDFVSDHSSTMTALNIITQSIFDLKAKKIQKTQPDCQTRIQKLCALSTSLSKTRRTKPPK